MARRTARPAAPRRYRLDPEQRACRHCGQLARVAYHDERTVATLDGLYQLVLAVRRCGNAACPLHRQAYRPEEEGSWALPHGEFGLDVIALVGQLRSAEHRSIPEIHQALLAREVSIAERSVTNLLYRYEELVALHLADAARLRARLAQQPHVILAIDGMQPDKGHEGLWVLRDCVSGEVLLARSLLSARAVDLAPLLETVREAVPVPITGVISDGQASIRNAVATVFPAVPHQVCQFHYLREAAKPIVEADRHAKVQLKKELRGVRLIERSLEEQDADEAPAMRGYCLAVRSALTDDGRPPLQAAGLRLHDRVTAIHASLGRVAEKGGSRHRSSASSGSSTGGSTRPQRPGPPSAPPTPGCSRPRTCWRTRRSTMRRPSTPTTRPYSTRCAASRRPSGAWPRRLSTSTR